MELTCIMCPVGCTLKVEKNGEDIIVTGNACPRGAEYGAKEITAPERIVTTVKNYKNGTICLKTDRPIPKKLIDEILREIARKKVPEKIYIGDIFIKNILNTKSNIVVTEINL
ncbi:MAG: DUF1667 domain-containing protein [Clostridia bacterium]|nr:DUF1667 domain-containing protein [Clostridia bacterium]